MKILLYGLNFAPELTGIGKYTGELAAYLAQQGHSVRVITAPPYYPEWQVGAGYSAGQYRRETWQGVDVFRCPLYVPRKVTGSRRIVHYASFVASTFPALVRQAAWRPELIFAVAPSIFTAPSALLAGRLFGAKTWLHIQDFELDAAFNLGMIQGGGAMKRIAAGVERAILKGFDRVSTISNRMIERLLQKGVEQHRTVLFPNWADTEKIYPLEVGQNRAAGFREELGIAEQKTVVLYSGNMGRKQGIEILVDAARALHAYQNIHFVLCGDGVAREGLVRSAAGLENISFLPLQPIEKLNELLNMADIHVLPQRADAADLVMPSKLTGMLASGRPVIATAAAGTELHQVVDCVGITVPPENVSALTAAIRSLAEDAEKRDRMGRAGRQFVEQNWSRSHVIDAFVTSAQNLVKKSLNKK